MRGGGGATRTAAEHECPAAVSFFLKLAARYTRELGTFRVSLPEEILDLRDLALVLVPRIRVSAVQTLLTEARAAPDERIDGALELLDAILGLVG